MHEPVWVLDAAVEQIHRLQIAEHGGLEGIRDANLLDSALWRPKQLFSYLGNESSLTQLAAAYAFGIARNHPFIDGNKRTAFVVCLLFYASTVSILLRLRMRSMRFFWPWRKGD